MKTSGNLKLVFFFIVLTLILTWGVIFTWEGLFRAPVFQWIDVSFNRDYDFKQRVEHFIISTTVDLIVVSLLLWLVNREQRKLRLSEERYRALFEHASDGIAVIKASDRQIIEVNNKFCKILGYRPQELFHKSVAEVVSDNDNGSRLESLTQMIDSNLSGEIELGMQTSSGATIPASISFNTLLSQKEKLVILILRDLSERKRLEAEKEEMQQQLARNEKIAALGRATAQVAHEVKNPLTGLRLYSMHLKGKLADAGGPGEIALADKIVNTVDYLSETVDRVLNFARPITLARRPADFNRIVSDCLQMLEDQMVSNKIEKKVELAAGGAPLVLELDETLIRSALINLMVNAIQAMASGGVLSVKTELNDETARLTIADTGPGMPDAALEKIFEPFYSTKSRGLGLGMPYAKKVIEQQQGTIGVESRQGSGTRILIELPAGK